MTPKTAGNITPDSIRRRIAHMLGQFGRDALDWPEAHPVDLDSLQLVELAMHIEAEFDIDFRDDLIPPAPAIGDFVDMVEAALRQKSVDKLRGKPLHPEFALLKKKLI